MEQVLVLARNETVRLDSNRLDELFEQLGEKEAEEVVCRALEELAVRLAQTERYHSSGNLTDMRKSARSLAAIADQVGMALLVQVARDVKDCIDVRDLVALSATLARLIRIGEQSLTSFWDLQDLSL